MSTLKVTCIRIPDTCAYIRAPKNSAEGWIAMSTNPPEDHRP